MNTSLAAISGPNRRIHTFMQACTGMMTGCPYGGGCKGLSACCASTHHVMTFTPLLNAAWTCGLAATSYRLSDDRTWRRAVNAGLLACRKTSGASLRGATSPCKVPLLFEASVYMKPGSLI